MFTYYSGIDIGNPDFGHTQLNLLGTHTTVDGRVRVASDTALTLNLSSATKPDTAVHSVSGFIRFNKNSQTLLATQGSDCSANGTTYKLIEAGQIEVLNDSVINRIREQNPNDPLLQALLNTSEADLIRIAEQPTPETSGGANKTEVDSHAFTFYGSYALGNYFVDARLTDGVNDNDSERTIAGTQAKASYDSGLLGLNVVGGYTWNINPQVLIEPRVTARYSLVNGDG